MKEAQRPAPSHYIRCGLETVLRAYHVAKYRSEYLYRQGVKRQMGKQIGQTEFSRAKPQKIWLYGNHAVKAAIYNPDREVLKIVATQTARGRLGEMLTYACLLYTSPSPRD